MIARIKHWIFTKGKSCKHCCIWCRFYEQCSYDTADHKSAITKDRETEDREARQIREILDKSEGKSEKRKN